MYICVYLKFPLSCMASSGRRERTPSSEFRAESDDLESMARPTEANSSCRSAAEKMQKPTQSEIEEFFADAEKDMQKRFTEK